MNLSDTFLRACLDLCAMEVVRLGEEATRLPLPRQACSARYADVGAHDPRAATTAASEIFSADFDEALDAAMVPM